MRKFINTQLKLFILCFNKFLLYYKKIIDFIWFIGLYFCKKNITLVFLRNQFKTNLILKEFHSKVNYVRYSKVNKLYLAVLCKLNITLALTTKLISYKQSPIYIIKPLHTSSSKIFSLNKMYIRASKCFSKTKYSFIRQECKNIVYLVLLINTLSISIFLNIYFKFNISVLAPYILLGYFIVYNWNYFISIVVNVKTTYLLWNHYKSRKTFGNYIDSKFTC